MPYQRQGISRAIGPPCIVFYRKQFIMTFHNEYGRMKYKRAIRRLLICHSERREESRYLRRWRFFTPLGSVQNDKNFIWL